MVANPIGIGHVFFEACVAFAIPSVLSGPGFDGVCGELACSRQLVGRVVELTHAKRGMYVVLMKLLVLEI